MGQPENNPPLYFLDSSSGQFLVIFESGSKLTPLVITSPHCYRLLDMWFSTRLMIYSTQTTCFNFKSNWIINRFMLHVCFCEFDWETNCWVPIVLEICSECSWLVDCYMIQIVCCWLFVTELLTMLFLISHAWMLIPMFDEVMFLLLQHHCMLWDVELVIDVWLWIVSCLKFAFALPICNHFGLCFVLSSLIRFFATCLQACLLPLHVSLRVNKHDYYMSRLIRLPHSILDDPMFRCVTSMFTASSCFATCLQTQLLHHEASSSSFGIPILVWQ